MTDVVKIAMERRARLAAEVSKLDDFVHVAEALLKMDLPNSNKALDTEGNEAAEAIGQETAPPHPAAPTAAAPTAAAAEAEGEDVSASKPKSGQRVRKARTVLGEALARSVQRESQSQRQPPV